MGKGEMFDERKMVGYFEDGFEIKRRHMHDFLFDMHKTPTMRQLLNRRSQPIRFSEIAIEHVVGINMTDKHMAAVINQYYHGMLRQMIQSFEAVNFMIYVIEKKPVTLENGKQILTAVPRRIKPGCYSIVHTRRSSDLDEKRYIRWDDPMTKINGYFVDSLFMTGSSYGTDKFDSECGILAPSFARLLRMRAYHEHAIEQRAKNKPWVQHMSAQQTMQPQNAMNYGPSFPGVTLSDESIDIIEKDRIVLLPSEHVMCSHQPIPPVPIDIKAEEDRFTEIAIKFLRLASWESHTDAKSQYKNDAEVAQETSQQRNALLEKQDDLSHALATIFMNCNGVYKIHPNIQVRAYASYETLRQMYLDGVIAEEALGQGILDTHAFNKDHVMPDNMKQHRQRLLENHREKDAPKQFAGSDAKQKLKRLHDDRSKSKKKKVKKSEDEKKTKHKKEKKEEKGE